MTIESHGIVERYLARPAAPVERADAEAILAHAASCKACGARLAGEPDHAFMVVEATHVGASPALGAALVIKAAQQQLVAFGKEMAPRLARTELPEPTAEQRERLAFAGGRELDARVAISALAAAEATLALTGVMSSRRGKPDEATIRRVAGGYDVEVGVAKKKVPGSYFASRIAEGLELDDDRAAAGLPLWNAAAGLCVESAELPDLHLTSRSDDEVHIHRAGFKPVKNLAGEITRELGEQFAVVIGGQIVIKTDRTIAGLADFKPLEVFRQTKVIAGKMAEMKLDFDKLEVNTKILSNKQVGIEIKPIGGGTETLRALKESMLPAAAKETFKVINTSDPSKISFALPVVPRKPK